MTAHPDLSTAAAQPVTAMTRPPDFLIIGAAKSATTWLQNSLRQSGTVFMPGPELHFFSREYGRGLGWYEAQFAAAGDALLLGEKSNSYLTEPAAAERIRGAAPGVRLIAQLRDPVARAYSDYCMLYRRGSVTKEIARYLDPDLAADRRFIGDGCYARHLRRFVDLFPREQLLVLFYEDIRTAPELQLEMVARHIGFDGDLAAPLADRVKDRRTAVVPRPLRQALRPVRPLLDPVRDSAVMRSLRGAVARPVRYPPLPRPLAAKLRDHYASDIAALEEIAGRRLEAWPSASLAS